ncbi:transposable element Tcb1 transposase [Trichonephila clavipes]|nr:transposable element Tcb1 transposase [Trichonephila clavipes]
MTSCYHMCCTMQRLPGAIFQQDNAWPHTARVSKDRLRTETTLPWPSRSPDLFPIEHMGNRFGRLCWDSEERKTSVDMKFNTKYEWKFSKPRSFIDESRFNFSSVDNRVRVWRPRGERLNLAFTLQRHTAPTAGVMVWGAVTYNTGSPQVLIRCTMTAQRYVHDILLPHVLHYATAPRSHFSTRQCLASHGKGVKRPSPH